MIDGLMSVLRDKALEIVVDLYVASFDLSEGIR